jgi:hypothetical protein
VRKEIDPEAQQELYEHPVDSLNLTNVIKSERSASHVPTLDETLAAWKAKARAAELPSDETMTQQLSSDELRRLRALGYVGGGAPTRPSTNTTVNASTNAVTGTNAPSAGGGAGSDKKEGVQ